MAFRVRIDSFEGPFDLLLYLVNLKKVDISSISIVEITDQYLAEVRRMQSLDLDVASDFLLVAATLLEIKAASLLPKDKDEITVEVEEMTVSEARDLLIERLLTYKQFKDAGAGLQALMEQEERRHPRLAGPDRRFQALQPDFLRGVTLERLGKLAAGVLGRKDVVLMDSAHIAANPIPLELCVRSLYDRVRLKKHLRFSELIAERATPEIVVVTLLALLELYKRRMVQLEQDRAFGDIAISYKEGAPELILDDELEEY